MTSQPQYLRYLASAKQAVIAEQLRREGYDVATDTVVGDTLFDLVARKGNKAIAYEFKAGRSSRTTKDGLALLQQSAADNGLELRIMVVNPPRRVKVEIEDLSELLLDHMVNKNFPHELDSLSTHTEIHGVSDLEVSELIMQGGSLHITGSATVDVMLRYGSGSDDGAASQDGFPFSFKVTLTGEGSLESVDELTVDTTSFYE